MEALREALFDIVEANQPCSVRSVYYVGIGRFWEKDRGGSRASYKRVGEVLGEMRERDLLPWEWITDGTRFVRTDEMFSSTEQALQRTAQFYRRNLWEDQPRRVEVWAESDSTSGIIEPITRKLGVGLFSCRGHASKSFAHTSAQTYRGIGKPVTIVYCGDWDPAGLGIPRSLEERLVRYSRDEVAIEMVRMAVTAEDVASGVYQAHATNTKDPNYKRFAEHCGFIGLDPQVSVEFEAVPPPVSRARLEDQLYGLVDDADTWNATLAAEESERTVLESMVRGLR